MEASVLRLRISVVVFSDLRVLCSRRCYVSFLSRCNVESVELVETLASCYGYSPAH